MQLIFASFVFPLVSFGLTKIVVKINIKQLANKWKNKTIFDIGK